ncbi:hypothetical protein AGMMS50276_29120 [Synergistales bacterium]|nr:hypothetical protein AGMMS50276_29120 [Synergistales bacterium]
MWKIYRTFYLNVAFLLTFVMSYSVSTSWSAEPALFFQDGKGLYDTLQSVAPGNSIEVAYDILGTLDGQESNALIWHHLIDREVRAVFCIAVSKEDTIEVSSYIEYFKTKQLALDRYFALRKDLSLILSPPMQEIPEAISFWNTGDLTLTLVVGIPNGEDFSLGIVLKDL